MTSRHICPYCGNKSRFLTVAHVAQTWEVDGNGMFLREISTDETTAPPDDGNIWTCVECGGEAVVFDPKKVAIRENPDKARADAVRKAVKENGGYCPCRIAKTEDNRCMCKAFREQEIGECLCGLYEKYIKI